MEIANSRFQIAVVCDGRSMQILARCPGCDAALPVNAAEAPAAIRCGRCGRELPLSFSDAVRADRAVDRCPACQGVDFYVRKDFNPQVGLTVVIVGALVSAAFYWFGRDLIAYGILGSAVLIDLIVYGRLKDLTVCYRCHTEFRGGYERRAGAFDLHTADVLEREYERKVGRR
jgi:DNA-directed RNA polymerase subunit RPC12/RpoP